jgi:hypothetical protein
VSALAAQATRESKDTQVFALKGLRTGYCVHFLVDPRLATKELRDGFFLLPADQDQTLHPALRQTLQAQPEFGSWSPASVCIYHLDGVQVGTRLVAEKDARKDQMVGVWSLAAREKKTGNRRDLVLDLVASRGALIRAAEGARVRLHEAEAAVSNADSAGQQYSVEIERARLVWSGRPTGNRIRVQEPIKESWSVPGLRAGVWNAEFRLSPEWSRSGIGSLRVEGKGDLAQALKTSPIRFVGPFYGGGGGELRFSR